MGKQNIQNWLKSTWTCDQQTVEHFLALFRVVGPRYRQLAVDGRVLGVIGQHVLQDHVVRALDVVLRQDHLLRFRLVDAGKKGFFWDINALYWFWTGQDGFLTQRLNKFQMTYIILVQTIAVDLRIGILAVLISSTYLTNMRTLFHRQRPDVYR